MTDVLVGDKLLDALAEGGDMEVPAIPALPPAGPAAQYHDFTDAKHVEIISDWQGVQRVIGHFKPLLANRTEPLLLAIDTETTAVDLILRRYEAAVQQASELEEEFKLLKKGDEGFAEMKKALDAARDHAAKMHKRVQKAGLNVYEGQVRLIQWYIGTDTIWVADRWALSPLDLQQLTDKILSHPMVVWVGHNMFFDVKMLAQHGVKPSGHVHCTQLQAHALDPLKSARKTLAARCSKMLGKEPNKELQASDWARPSLDPRQIRYAAGDVVAAYDLHFAQMDALAKLDAQPRLSIANGHFVTERGVGRYDLLRRAIPAVTEVHLTGFAFDRDEHTVIATKIHAEAESKRQWVIDGFKETADQLGAPVVENPGSSVQVSKWIKWALEQSPGAPQEGNSEQQWPKTKTGNLCTGADEITGNLDMIDPKIAFPLERMIQWAKVEKADSTLGLEFQRWINTMTHRIHASFRIGTETLRFSVADPALQTISRDSAYRKLFIALPGRKLVIKDYGQIEVRVAACLSGDKVLLSAIEDGIDLHALTALNAFNQHPDVRSYLVGRGLIQPNQTLTPADVFILIRDPDVVKQFVGDPADPHFKPPFKWMRQAAKTTLFATQYGAGPKTIYIQLRAAGATGITVELCRQIQLALFAMFPDYARWMQDVRDESMGTPDFMTNQLVGGTGLCWTPFGGVYEPDNPNQLYTKSVNTPVQGGAAEIMLRALGYFPKMWGSLDAKLVHIVHDELIADVAEDDADEADKVMTKAMTHAAVSLYPDIPRRGLVGGGIGDNWGDK